MQWLVHFLLFLSAVAPGDCLHACHLQRLMVGETAQGCTPSAFCGSNRFDPQDTSHSHDGSPSCSCELRKDLAQPHRAASESPAFALDYFFLPSSQFVRANFPSAEIEPSQVWAVKLISHSPPLLI
jgi:hypothetical protein